jgi:uncharacterized membrane protein
MRGVNRLFRTPVLWIVLLPSLLMVLAQILSQFNHYSIDYIHGSEGWYASALQGSIVMGYVEHNDNPYISKRSSGLHVYEYFGKNSSMSPYSEYHEQQHWLSKHFIYLKSNNTYYRRDIFITVSWQTILVVIVLSLYFVFHKYMILRNQEASKHLCAKCGYSLYKNISGTCPECGYQET